MLAIAIGTFYICLHFSAYALFARGVPLLRTEQGIFLLHFISAGAATLAAFILTVSNGYAEAITVTTAVAAAHGIYSMSFLELWSLSQGSYSFTILAAIARGGRLPAATVVRESGSVGDQKKEQRIDGLAKLRLLDMKGGVLTLRPAGHVVARFFCAIRWIANLRDTG